jgi:hypothetical protein
VALGEAAARGRTCGRSSSGPRADDGEMQPKRGGARDDAHSARDDAISARDDARSACDDARSARDAAGDDGEPHAHHLMREVIRGHRRSSEVIR